jgi:hypothetical protein
MGKDKDMEFINDVVTESKGIPKLDIKKKSKKFNFKNPFKKKKRISKKYSNKGLFNDL